MKTKFWEKIKRKRLTALGLGLIIFGILLLPKGLPLVLNPIPPQERTEDVVHSTNLNKLTSINMIGGTDNPPVQAVKINFETTTIFEGDSVWVRATAYGVKPHVVAVILITTEPNKIYPINYTGRDMDHDVGIAQAFNQSITLFPQSSPPFETRQELANFQAFQPVSFHGFVLLDDGTFTHLNTKGIAFSILPKTDKLQSEANIAMLKQINATKKATLAQDEYNNIVLGLTWLGIAAIPILVGSDILLRIYVST